MAVTAATLIREARHRAGMTQTALARKAGVDQSVISTYEAGRRDPGFDMLSKLVNAAGASIALEYAPSPPAPPDLPDTPRGRKLHRHRKTIIDLVHARGADNIYVFGSVARGDDGPKSDIDLLVDIPADFSLFDLGELTLELSELLGERVDAVPARGLATKVGNNALRDAIPL